jgi:hypothetical protein
MKKYVLALSLMVLLSMIGMSMAENYIGITVKGSTATKIGNLKQAGAGSYYWIADLTIENHGYEKFVVDPATFVVMVAGGFKNIDKATYYLDSIGKTPLPNIELANGETAKGSLAFLLTTNNDPSNPYRSMDYTGPEIIHWSGQGT